MTLTCSVHFGYLGFGPKYGPSDSKALHMEEWWRPHPPLPAEVHVKSGPVLLGYPPITFLCGPKSSPRKPTKPYGSKTSIGRFGEVTNRDVIYTPGSMHRLRTQSARTRHPGAVLGDVQSLQQAVHASLTPLEGPTFVS